MKVQEALKAAQKVICEGIYSDDGMDGDDGQKALLAIEAALADIDKCEPVGWQFYQDGEWHNGMETNNHKENTIDAGFPIRELYTSPQPIEKCEPVGELILDPALLPALKSPLVNWKINLVDLEVGAKFYARKDKQ